MRHYWALLSAMVCVFISTSQGCAHSASPKYVDVDLRTRYLEVKGKADSAQKRAELDEIVREYTVRTMMMPGERREVKIVVMDEKGRVIKPVRYGLRCREVVREANNPQEKGGGIAETGEIVVSLGRFNVAEISIDGSPYFGGNYALRDKGSRRFSLPDASDEEVITRWKEYSIRDLEAGAIVPLKGDPERLAFVVRDIKDEPESKYASGVPEWLPKNQIVKDFQGDIALDKKISDAIDLEVVKAPVDGKYGIYEAKTKRYYSTCLVKKGTPLGFERVSESKVKTIMGVQFDDIYDVESGISLEWCLKTARPNGIPESRVSGDPNWVEKGFEIRAFEGELKSGDVVMDSTRSQAVRVPVAGVYRLSEKGNHSNTRGAARAEKGTALGFDLSRKKQVSVVRGKDRWDWWPADGKVWEWRLESVGLEHKAEGDVKQ